MHQALLSRTKHHFLADLMQVSSDLDADAGLGPEVKPSGTKGRAQQSALDKAPPVFPVRNQVPYA